MVENNKDNCQTKFLDPLSEEIWAITYKDYKDGTVDDTFRRVAKDIASVESVENREHWENIFFDMLSNFKVTVGGRIYSNAGTEWAGTTYANCFVSPYPSTDVDSINGIYEVLVKQAKTLKSEGGWGFNFSLWRPRGSFIKGVGVESPGAVKFMELFDKSSDIVTAGSGKVTKNSKAKGKIRKGAMMGVMDCTHPDIVEFITAKQIPGRLTKFNISVNCTKEFMDKVNNLDKDPDEDWDLEFPDTDHPAYKVAWKGNLSEWKEKGFPTIVHETVKVKWLWNLITESTYNRNEPGVLFLDRANEFNPLYYGETIVATNPCGEQTLAPAGICCLGSINLTQFILPDYSGFDLDRLKTYSGYLVRFLDNVNTRSDAPLPEYVDSMRNKRRIGCGVLGWGSALMMLRVPFGSKKAEELRTEIMQTIAKSCYETSIDLAIEKGPFLHCVPDFHAKGKFVLSLGLSPEYMEKLKKYGIRNSSLLSAQPTGNTSLFANIVSGGIEPVYMSYFVRTMIVPTIPEELIGKIPDFRVGEFKETELFKWVKEGDDEILKATLPDGTVYKIDRNRGLTKEVLCIDYGVRNLQERGLWDPNADWAKTTTVLSVTDHINDLKGFARYMDSACSKTCNLSNDYPFEEFKNLYLDAYNSGVIKGFTTYRTGTMASVLSAADERTAGNDEEEIIVAEAKLPDSLPATLKTLRAEGRKWYLTLLMNESQTRPVALFVQTNAHEKSITANDASERLIELARLKGIKPEYIDDVVSKTSVDNNPTKICRAIGLCLRHGVLIRNIVSTLEKVDCVAGSFVFHIRKYLATFIKDGVKVEGEKCLECNSENIVYQEGCKICKNCGSSKCG